MSHLPARWPAIGIFGGTFDPVHFGHLRTAFECRERLGLEEVRFVPCADPPHRSVPTANADLRLRMVTAAVSPVDGFRADSREFDRQGPSYTVETLHSFRAEFPDHRLCLMLGLDAFVTLDAWRNWRELFELAHIVVARRPGAEMPAGGAVGRMLEARFTDSVDILKSEPAGRIFPLDVTQLDIASTALRSSIADGVRPVYLLPAAVWQIILEERCYGA